MLIFVAALAFSGGAWNSQDLPEFLACTCSGTKEIKMNKAFWHCMSWKSLIQYKPAFFFFFFSFPLKGKESNHVGVMEKRVWVPFGLCCSVFSLVISKGGESLTQTRENVLHGSPGAWHSCGLHTLRCQPGFQAPVAAWHVTQAQRTIMKEKSEPPRLGPKAALHGFRGVFSKPCGGFCT